jgi:NTP pyrophosphatase (non-canonical NTP hydrolase)
MTDLEELQKLVVAFRDARNWKQFHKPKDMAISLCLEAAELLEHFQWKSEDEFEEHMKNRRDDVSDELVDVLYWVLLMAHDLDVDIPKEFERKMAKNAKKYPVEKSSGKHSKYTELA